jgi:hypothetical protein
MVNLKVNKLRMMAAASVVVFALASAPANAHHGHDILGPAVAFIALGALFHHGHHGHYGHYGHRRHYGHYRPHQYKRHRRHSHSHGGYHKPRRKHYNH